jgi:hypothetical protein
MDGGRRLAPLLLLLFVLSQLRTSPSVRLTDHIPAKDKLYNLKKKTDHRAEPEADALVGAGGQNVAGLITSWGSSYQYVSVLPEASLAALITEGVLRGHGLPFLGPCRHEAWIVFMNLKRSFRRRTIGQFLFCFFIISLKSIVFF